MSYDHRAIEAKWQDRWESEGVFHTTEDSTRPKFYNVAMYPYPSGELHIGHVRNYTYIDLITRYKMMQGFNVLSPMGWDSFGLPAENLAIETGIHPRVSVEAQITRMKEHFRKLGAAFDWSREVASHDPAYYRWDQWLFLELYDRGLAYKATAPVNWCPKDQTVLANEQVVDGACERCGTLVEKRNLAQWFFKITDYADRLLDDLDHLDDWPDRVRTMQRNWIGRSEGARFRISIDGIDASFDVFTTRPDTIFGMTFCVLAPEHPLVEELISGTDVEAEAREYMVRAARESEIERLAEGEKIRRVHRPVRHQPGEREAGSHLHRRLCVDGLRHRGDHGRPGSGSARLGFCCQVWPRHHSHGRPRHGLGGRGLPRGWADDQF